MHSLSKTTLALLAGMLMLLAGCSNLMTEPAEEALKATNGFTSAACADPAPLKGDPAGVSPAYIVVYQYDESRSGEVEDLTRRLAEEYDFEPEHIYSHALQGFSADLSDEALANIRCEAVVDYVEHNSSINID